MSMGSVVMRPQALTVTATEQDRLVLAATDLLEAFARDEDASLEALGIALEEIEMGMRDFVVGLEEPLRFAEGKVRNLFAPVADVLEVFTDGIGEGGLDSVPAVMSAVTGVVGLLTAEQIGGLARGLIAIAEEDLNITAATVTGLAGEISAAIETRCKEPLLDGAADVKSVNLYEIGSCLERLRFLLGEETVDFTLDLESFVVALEARWAASDLGRLADLVADFLAAGTDVVEAVFAIVQLLSETEIEVDVHSPNLGGASEVEMTTGQSPGDPVAWYASWVAGKTMKYPADESLPQHRFHNEWLAGFDYKHVSKEKMEAIARISAWAATSLEMFFHAISIEKGDIVSNTVNIGMDTVDVVLKAKGIKLPAYAHWIGYPAYTFLAGLEGGRFGDAFGNDPYPWFNAGHDLVEGMLYRRWTWLMRETLLSTLTLLNNDPAAFANFVQQASGTVSGGIGQSALDMAKKRHNNNCIEGVCYALGELGGLIVPLVLSETNRHNAGLGPGVLAGSIGQIIGGAAVGSAFLYTGVFLTRVMAGQWPTDWSRYARLVLYERIFGKYDFSSGASGTWAVFRVLIAMLHWGTTNFFYLYLFTTGNTDDGTYCVDLNLTERDFAGYPSDAASSPYLLPYPAGTTYQAVQGNMGFWSHYPASRQTYAYDFSHDLSDEILCSRAGIVTFVDDTQIDNNPNSWNVIEVMHVIVNPTDGTGWPAVAAPAGSTFGDTGAATGTVTFPPYWPNAAAGNPGAPIVPPLHSTATAAAFPASATFSFVLSNFDRGISGVTFSGGVTFSDGTPIPAGAVFAPDATAPPAPGTNFPAGTTFIPSFGATPPAFLPLRGTFCTYGHGKQAFLGPVFGAANTAAASVQGRFVKQGQPIMLAGDTGISFFNHLHTHVTTTSQNSYTIPFVYADAEHTIANGIYKGLKGNGRPRATTYYTSKNTRNP